MIHVVSQGECLSAIARKYGFSKYESIYDHPSNADFKKKRKDPNVIFPGDEIFIPEKDLKKESCGSEALHTFQVTLPKRKLKVRMQDALGDPIADMPYTLLFLDSKIEATTGGDGLIEHDLPVHVATVTLLMAGTKRTLSIAHLNPLDETDDDVSGVQARLKNLGYDPGPIDGIAGPRTLAAARAFREHEGLEGDAITPELVAKLQEKHGA